MKRGSIRALILLVIGAARLAAAEPQPVVIDYRAYVAPQEDAYPLMEQLRGSDANATIRRMDGMIGNGKIRLAAITKIHGVSGAPAGHSGGDELRWPIEWAQPIQIGGFGSRIMDGKPAGDFILPTTFESNYLGPRVEVTADFTPDGKQSTLAIDAKLVRLSGWIRPPAAFTGGGVALSFPQPHFARSSVTTRIIVPLQRWTLLSAQTDAKDPGQIILHTIRATAPSSDRAPANRQP